MIKVVFLWEDEVEKEFLYPSNVRGVMHKWVRPYGFRIHGTLKNKKHLDWIYTNIIPSIRVKEPADG